VHVYAFQNVMFVPYVCGFLLTEVDVVHGAIIRFFLGCWPELELDFFSINILVF
jgi:hypothetical protein